MQTVLVTGGAGYIGSHVAAALLERTFRVIVFDNLSTGHPAAVPVGAVFVQGDLADTNAVARLFSEYAFDAVMHFAARSLVGESMQQPFLYLEDNVANALKLLRIIAAHGVKKFVFSSTANLFGEPETIPISENATIAPGSPYGESKYLIERALAWAERLHGIRYATLRYFNAAGADPGGMRGEDHRPETHLIPIALQVALGQRSHLDVFGNDFATADGSCIRDYVHVLDLAEAHILALGALERASCCYNLGNGQGYSVLQVIETIRVVTGAEIPVSIGPRRQGDPPVLVANAQKIKQELGWQPNYADLRSIISTAWEWHRGHPNGYTSRPLLKQG